MNAMYLVRYMLTLRQTASTTIWFRLNLLAESGIFNFKPFILWWDQLDILIVELITL